MFFNDNLLKLVPTDGPKTKELTFLVHRIQQLYHADDIIIQNKTERSVLFSSFFMERGDVDCQSLNEIASEIYSRFEPQENPYSGEVYRHNVLFFSWYLTLLWATIKKIVTS